MRNRLYNRDQIKEILHEENFYIDDFIFDAFAKNWKIEAIYEDENGVEFYDNDALDYIRDGLKGKQPEVQELSEAISITDQTKTLTEQIIKGSSKKKNKQIIDDNLFFEPATEKIVVKSTTEEKRKAKEEAKRKAEEEAKRKAEEEAKRKAEEEAKRKAEEEAKRKAEEEAKRKAEEEAKRKAEEEAKRKAEEEAKRKAEEEAKRKAEEEAKRKAEEEAKRKAEEEAKRKAEEEAKRKAEEEAKRKAEEEAKRKAEEEAKRKAEELARTAEEKRLADETQKVLAAEKALWEEAKKVEDARLKKEEELANEIRQATEEAFKAVNVENISCSKDDIYNAVKVLNSDEKTSLIKPTENEENQDIRSDDEMINLEQGTGGVFEIVDSQSKLEKSDDEKSQEIISKQRLAVQSTVSTLHPQDYDLDMQTDLARKKDNKNLTVDISAQTLNALANALAQKISAEVNKTLALSTQNGINSQLQNNRYLEQKIEEVIEDNKFLLRKLQELESENSRYVKVVGNLYMKNE